MAILVIAFLQFVMEKPSASYVNGAIMAPGSFVALVI